MYNIIFMTNRNKIVLMLKPKRIMETCYETSQGLAPSKDKSINIIICYNICTVIKACIINWIVGFLMVQFANPKE